MTVNTGTQLGHYEIRSTLGAGGMGEVYLAQDTRLRRPVALKLLSARFTEDEDRLRRFEQEACAASALNHPNIITIHEIGHEDSVHFIATEFVEGETLRQRLQSSPLKLREALDVAVQIADALRVAHAAGIVHRDIKPENIMVRPDGYIKVLDFGLAKLAEQSTPLGSALDASSVDTQAPTIAKVSTDPGTIMGTVHYMSPEQARGQKVDARTDIWSLGVVLYEMVTGRGPFAGETPTDVLVAVLDREPASLQASVPGAPAELQRIVRKALRKDKEERYQTIKDFLIDLKALKQELEVEARLEHSMPPESNAGSGPGFTASSGPARVEVTRETAPQTAEVALPTFQGEHLTGGIKRGGHRFGMALAALALLFIAIALGLYFLVIKLRSANRSPVFMQDMQVTQLTTSGKAADAVVSPDGKYVAYVMDDAGRQSLWLRHVPTASNVLVVAPADVSYQGLAFSHDSNHIYYNMWDRKGVGVIYQVPVVGGAAPRRVIVDVMPGVNVSPDNERLSFVRGYASDNSGALIVASTDGTGERELLKRVAPDGIYGGVWSPDGKKLAVVLWNDSGKNMSIVELPASGGQEKQITSQKWAGVGGLSWLGDGSGLVMIATEQRRSPPQIWYISYPEGEAKRVTNDLSGYGNLSLTDDSSTLVTVRSNGVANIWVTTPTGENSRSQQLTSGNTEGGNGLDWTPNDKIVYSSVSSGNWDIWIMEADGSGQKQLTFNAGANRLPTVSPDGRYIVFVSDRSETDHLWRINIDGSNPKQLTTVDGDSYPSISPDSQWVFYTSISGGKPSLWKVSIEGGTPVQVNNQQTPEPVVSPDGKLIACSLWDEQSDPQQWRVALISTADGHIIKTLETPRTAVGGVGIVHLRWTPDGKSLAYIDNRGGNSNIWTLPLDGSPPKQLTGWKSDRIFWFNWSRDGKQLACARGNMTSDIFLIKGFK